jgi:LEA14-like dessication related protein
MKYRLFIIIVLILASCKVKEVEIGKIKDYRLVNIGENKADIEVSLPVKNNNSWGFTVSKVNLKLFLDDKEIGKVVEKDKVKILPRSSQIYPIILELSIDKTIGTIPTVIASTLKNRTGIKIKGYVKVRKFIICKKFYVEEQENIKIF